MWSSALETTEPALAGNDGVDGIMPVLDVRVPVMNEGSGQSEPVVILTGLDQGHTEKILVGAGLVTVMALLLDGALGAVQRRLPAMA